MLRLLLPTQKSTGPLCRRYQPALWLEQLEERGALSATPLTVELLPPPSYQPNYVIFSTQPPSVNETSLSLGGLYQTDPLLAMPESVGERPAGRFTLSFLPDTSLVPGKLPPEGDPGLVADPQEDAAIEAFEISLIEEHRPWWHSLRGLTLSVWAVRGETSYAANTELQVGDTVTFRLHAHLQAPLRTELSREMLEPLLGVHADQVKSFLAVPSATVPRPGQIQPGPTHSSQADTWADGLQTRSFDMLYTITVLETHLR